MFKLTKPCANCPFRKGQGESFMLGTERVMEILNGNAFQCHKTVDYNHEDDPYKRQGKNPQQCVGVMSLLHRAQLPNQIMQVAERLRAVTPDYFDKLDHGAVYDDVVDALEAHSCGDRNWPQRVANYEPRVIATEPTRAAMPDFVRAWEGRASDGESFYQ
jgi:hypothetical protein